MRILVTGARGFLGGCIAGELLVEGHRVIAGTRSRNDLPAVLAGAEWMETPWQDLAGLEALCSEVDLVVHAAGMNAAECQTDPEAALEFNGNSTAELARVAANAGVERFIYLSTVHVYGSPLTGEFDECSGLLNQHPYATTHRAGEIGLQAATTDSSMQGVVLRLSNVFGAPLYKDVDCWMLLVNNLCRQIIEGHEMALQSSGHQLRDFVTRKRVCEIVSLLCREIPWPGHFTVFNVASGNAISVRELATLVQERADLKLGFRPVLRIPGSKHQDREGGQSLRLSIDKIKTYLPLHEEEPEREIDELLSFCEREFGEQMA
jgi:UDP-glucose 4-epimerase